MGLPDNAEEAQKELTDSDKTVPTTLPTKTEEPPAPTPPAPDAV